MLRGKKLALIVLGLVIVVAAAVYGLGRRQHQPPGPYAVQIERLHEINHEMRDIWHTYKKQHEGEGAFQRWHDLLHEEKEILHTLPQALDEGR